jgi:hypothetical protein
MEADLPSYPARKFRARTGGLRIAWPGMSVGVTGSVCILAKLVRSSPFLRIPTAAPRTHK